MKIVINEHQKRVLLENIESELKNINTEPSEAQKKAGNYKMGHIVFSGFKITIENPKGSIRKYKNPSGRNGQNKMKNHYGYFTKTKGKDNDQIDVFLGPNENSKNVYVVDQNNKDGEFDESKVMLGFNSEKDAKKAYFANFSKGWKGFRNITGVPKEVFKKWLYDGKKQIKPFSDYNFIKENLTEEIVYHGTDYNFDKFSSEFNGKSTGLAYGYGTYVTNSKQIASSYGNKIIELEIPDNNGNYLIYDKPLSKKEKNYYNDKLISYILESDPEMYDEKGILYLRNEINSLNNITEGEFFNTLSDYLGDDEEVSAFCYNKLKKIGLKYKSNKYENTLMFNPKDIKIIKK